MLLSDRCVSRWQLCNNPLITTASSYYTRMSRGNMT